MRAFCPPASLHPFLPANFKEQAGRSQGGHNHVRDSKERAPNPNLQSRWKPKWMKTVGLNYRPVPIQLGVVT
jgi:hypothetical protein